MKYQLNLVNIKASIEFKEDVEDVNPDLFGRICGLISKLDIALELQFLKSEYGADIKKSLIDLGKIETDVLDQIGQIESENNVVISW